VKKRRRKMKTGLAEIICVVDKSGSMQTIRAEAIGAFNAFLGEQKKHPGEATFTLTLFDTKYDVRLSGKPIADVQDLTEESYVPGGMTALLDAVGRTIDEVGARFAKMEEDARPERVILAIITDGQENSSREYTRQQVSEKIKTQRDDYKWEIVFLAAGEEAVAEARGLGIAADHTVPYKKGDPQAHVAAVRCFSQASSAYRSGDDANWKQ
jgi:Mg-chelatase subunit ChlD